MSNTCVEIAKQYDFLTSNLDPKEYVDFLFWKINYRLMTILLVLALFGCQVNNTDQPSTETPTSLMAPEWKEPSGTPPDVTESLVAPVDNDFALLEVYVFDIGTADAILIITDNHTIMIDTGENQHGQIIVDELTNRGITEIDYLIISHFHKDHVGGANIIIKDVTVKDVIVPNYGKDSKPYDRFAAAMYEAGLECSILTETMRFNFDNVAFTLYPSQQEYYHYSDSGSDDNEDDDDDNDDGEDDDGDIDTPKENNFSIVVSATHGSNNFLFTGDAKAKRLKELLLSAEILNIQYDYLKVPHHGRYNKRSTEFLYTLAPKYAIITCSQDDPADERVIETLEIMGTEIYSTINGNVYCVSDGDSVNVAYR